MTDTFFTECAAIAYVPPPNRRKDVIARPRFIASSLLRRDAWAKVKGFPENLRSAEDLDLHGTVGRAGYRAVFEPRAQVYWRLRSALNSTFKRFLVYSLNNIRAGLFNQWQARILFRYAILAGLFVSVADRRAVMVLVAARFVGVDARGALDCFDLAQPHVLSRGISAQCASRRAW